MDKAIYYYTLYYFKPTAKSSQAGTGMDGLFGDTLPYCRLRTEQGQLAKWSQATMSQYMVMYCSNAMDTHIHMLTTISCVKTA